MLDIYNHLAVFGILFVCIFVVNIFRQNDGFNQYPVEYFFLQIMLSFIVMGCSEILAWSIWYLNGGVL